jgi:8-oxo-dGTP pyrophosphatase MutT (NUDIX family)
MGKVTTCGVFIINKNNEVLICHPTRHPQTEWSIPKGKIEKGEDFVDAAIRETFEETNVDLTHVSSIIKLDSQLYNHKKKVLQPFLVLELKNPNIDFNSFEFKCNSNVPEERGGFPEMDDFKWVTIESARELLHYTQSNCLDKILEIMKIEDLIGKMK